MLEDSHRKFNTEILIILISKSFISSRLLYLCKSDYGTARTIAENAVEGARTVGIEDGKKRERKRERICDGGRERERMGEAENAIGERER